MVSDIFMLGLLVFALNGLIMLGMYNKMVEFNRKAHLIEQMLRQLKLKRRI